MITPSILSTRLPSALPARALAQNTTAIDKHVGWVSSGSGRSTSGILWSCFSILLVCTYKCIHFNVPSLEESEAGFFTWRWWRKWLKKIGWMLLIVLAPEIGVSLAMSQYLLAREQCHEYNSQKKDQKKDKENALTTVKRGEEDIEKAKVEENMDEEEEQEVTKTHIFFANMGGFNLRVCALSLPAQGHTQRMEAPLDDISNTDVVIDKLVIMREITFPLRNWQELASFWTVFPDLKIPTEKEINDLSKADAFTKAFACIQSGWLVVQSIARVSVGLPITQLELATMAFVVCALAMYLTWWDKPFGVEHRTSITVVAYEESAKNYIVELLSNYFPGDLSFFTEMIGSQSTGKPIQKAEFNEGKIEFVQRKREIYEADLDSVKFGEIFGEGVEEFSKNTLSEFRKAIGIIFRNIFGNSDFAQPPRKQTGTLAFYATSLLFSALHIAAWNWEFSSSTTRELWRIFAITATGTCLIMIFLILVSFQLDKLVNRTIDFLSGLSFIFIFISHVFSRLGLIVLIFYSFSSMPAGVYDTVDWLQYLPSFS